MSLMDFGNMVSSDEPINPSTRFTVRHWTCELCDTHNHLSREKCLDCGNDRPKKFSKEKVQRISDK